MFTRSPAGITLFPAKQLGPTAQRKQVEEVAHINLTFDAVLWILMGKHTPVSALPILHWSQLIQGLTCPPSTHEYDVRWIWPFDPNPREEASYTSASYSDGPTSGGMHRLFFNCLKVCYSYNARALHSKVTDRPTTHPLKKRVFLFNASL